MAEVSRIDELTEQWQARGLKYDDAAEFINLLLARLGDLCSGPHLTLASTEELLEAVLRRTWDAGMSARVVHALTTSELKAELYRRYGAPMRNTGFTQEYPATPEESFTADAEHATPAEADALLRQLERIAGLLHEQLEMLRLNHDALTADTQPAICLHEWRTEFSYGSVVHDPFAPLPFVCTKCGIRIVPLT